MAIIRGKPGRYTGEEAARLRRRCLLLGLVMVGVLGFGEGVTLSHLWSKMHPPGWLTALVQVGGLVAICAMVRWGWLKLDEWEADRIKWEKGDEGEKTVGKILATLSDDYEVINDISTATGNLDHVVVGPTGVFVLDAKNWRGVVQADGKGELLLNGKRTDKADIRIFVGRIMGVKEKVRTLAAGADPYFQGLFVFTAARVEAARGKTGRVNCLREDQLRDYIVENEFGKPLEPDEVQRVAQAFLGLAHMDRGFTDNATQGITHEANPVGVAQMAKS